MSQKKKIKKPATPPEAKSPVETSPEPKKKAVKKTPPKALTATQLFSAYMHALGKVRRMATTLAEETAKVDQLRDELATRFNIYVSGQQPNAKPTRAGQPPLAPQDRVVVNEGAAEGDSEFKPPAQYHAPAVTIPDTGAVDQIREDSGLSVSEQEDSEALAADGMGMMDALAGSMGGSPTVPPQPGEHERGAQPTQRSNVGGGPVAQKPVEGS